MALLRVLFCALIITVYACFFIPAEIYGESQQLKLTAELCNFSEITLRTVIRYQIVTAVCVYKQDTLTSIGFSTPFSVLGTVIYTGLLREIRNPLGFSAGSGMWRERTDIRLTTAMDGGRYWALALKPVPGCWLLYYLGKKDIPFSLGTIIRLEVDRALKIETLLSTSMPRAPTASTDWFAEKHRFSGGRLFHFGSRITLRRDAVYAIGSGGISGGSLVLPGYFFDLVGGMNTDPFSAVLIFGYADSNYTSPDAVYGSENILYGGLVRFTPFPWLELGQKYRRIIEQGNSGSKEKLSSYLDLTFNIRPDMLLYVDSAYSASFYYPRDDRDFAVHNLAFTTTIKTAGMVFSTEIALKNIGSTDVGSMVRLQLELENDICRLMLRVKNYWKHEKATFDFAAYFSLSFCGQKIYVKLNTIREIDPPTLTPATIVDNFNAYFSFTIGWEGVW